MVKSGAALVIKTLEEEKVEFIFGYPGGATLPIYDKLENSDIRHILCRHEQGCVHMADGYARATGKTGICFATSGPGATNLVTGIATAFMDSVPIIAITGQVPREMIGNDGLSRSGYNRNNHTHNKTQLFAFQCCPNKKYHS